MKISAYKQSFGTAAKDYQKYRDYYDKKAFKLLFSLIKNSRGDKLLELIDIGCGTGKSTEPILGIRKNRKNISVVGFDPDIKMLQEAKLHAKKLGLPITYVRGLAEKMPFKQGTFDAAISGTAFHWFGTKKALAQVKKILKPGAPFFVLWTQYVDTGKPTIGRGLFKKYKFIGIPQKFRDTEYVKKVLRNAGFSRVTTEKIPFVERKTTEELIGTLKTGGTFTLLSPKQQKDFIKEMTSAYKEALGKHKYDVRKKKLVFVMGLNKISMEIERKFLVKELPDLSGLKPIRYERYFLKPEGSVQERIQKKGDVYEHEIIETKPSVGNVIQRLKTKKNISEEEFEILKNKSDGKCIVRDGYQLTKSLSVKIYQGEYEGLIRAEVEFDSEEEAKSYIPEAWMGPEITNTVLGEDARLLHLSKNELISTLKRLIS